MQISILGFILVAKALAWGGVKGRKELTPVLRFVFVVVALAVCVLLITITDLRKPDNEPWSNLQKLWLHQELSTEPDQRGHLYPDILSMHQDQWGDFEADIRIFNDGKLRVYPGALGKFCILFRKPMDDIAEDKLFKGEFQGELSSIFFTWNNYIEHNRHVDFKTTHGPDDPDDNREVNKDHTKYIYVVGLLWFKDEKGILPASEMCRYYIMPNLNDFYFCSGHNR
jgi:hypothetical protein